MNKTKTLVAVYIYKHLLHRCHSTSEHMKYTETWTGHHRS